MSKQDITNGSNPVFEILRSDYDLDDDNMHTMEIQCYKFRMKIFYMGNYLRDKAEGKLNVSHITILPVATKPLVLKPFVAYDGICIECDISLYRVADMDRVFPIMQEDLALAKEFEKFFLQTFPGIYSGTTKKE